MDNRLHRCGRGVRDVEKKAESRGASSIEGGAPVIYAGDTHMIRVSVRLTSGYTGGFGHWALVSSPPLTWNAESEVGVGEPVGLAVGICPSCSSYSARSGSLMLMQHSRLPELPELPWGGSLSLGHHRMLPGITSAPRSTWTSFHWRRLLKRWAKSIFRRFRINV